MKSLRNIAFIFLIVVLLIGTGCSSTQQTGQAMTLGMGTQGMGGFIYTNQGGKILLTTTDLKRPYKIVGVVMSNTITMLSNEKTITFPQSVISKCDAVINIRLIHIEGTCCCYLAYGTAVKFVKEGGK